MKRRCEMYCPTSHLDVTSGKVKEVRLGHAYCMKRGELDSYVGTL